MQIRWRSVPFRWRPALVLLLIGYFFFFILIPSYVPDAHKDLLIAPDSALFVDPVNSRVIEDVKDPIEGDGIVKAELVEQQIRPNPKILKPKKPETEIDNGFSFKLHYRGKDVYIESVLTHAKADSLQTRVTLDPKLTKTRRVIKAVDTPFNQGNLGGCPDWNCELSSGSDYGDVVILQSPRPKYPAHKKNTVYVFYSQESTRNSPSLKRTNLFNMTLGYRHDSPAASPYGYTAKLAPQSRKPPHAPVADEALINGKTKGVAWFVSHCNTQSHRETLVKELQKHIQVDIYGSCGPLNCRKGSSCEKIDTDYHFYLSVENSICEDYITEKLWNQGYGNTVIPIVLKRKLVEPYAPPGSFIAFDDYENLEAMGKHLNQLMKDKVAYSKYFDWRRDYIVIYLNGLAHDALERPWGFCQLCRVAQLMGAGVDPNDIPLFKHEDLGAEWDNSCDEDGALANKLLNQTPKVDSKPLDSVANDDGSGSFVTSAMSLTREV
uniref:Fucosyltransferase n=1 Tax=Panagrellus redivivus TaxID=6233 RepID=A0A7E4UVR0_PANRE